MERRYIFHEDKYIKVSDCDLVLQKDQIKQEFKEVDETISKFESLAKGYLFSVNLLKTAIFVLSFVCMIIFLGYITIALIDFDQVTDAKILQTKLSSPQTTNPSEVSSVPTKTISFINCSNNSPDNIMTCQKETAEIEDQEAIFYNQLRNAVNQQEGYVEQGSSPDQKQEQSPEIINSPSVPSNMFYPPIEKVTNQFYPPKDKVNTQMNVPTNRINNSPQFKGKLNNTPKNVLISKPLKNPKYIKAETKSKRNKGRGMAEVSENVSENGEQLINLNGKVYNLVDMSKETQSPVKETFGKILCFLLTILIAISLTYLALDYQVTKQLNESIIDMIIEHNGKGQVFRLYLYGDFRHIGVRPSLENDNSMRKDNVYAPKETIQERPRRFLAPLSNDLKTLLKNQNTPFDLMEPSFALENSLK